MSAEAKPEPRWLTDAEQRAWRAYLEGTHLLMHHLERGHHQQGLSSTDFDIMVRLSETSEHQMRMSQLAVATLLEKSRLSHQITRMERAGLVIRKPCADDRRGQFAVLTEHGWETLQRVAATHVEQVRDSFIDLLTPAQLRILGEAFGQVATAMRKPRPTDCARALGYEADEDPADQG
jgi:DNA-binding MarR family transcriptional regulator